MKFRELAASSLEACWWDCFSKKQKYLAKIPKCQISLSLKVTNRIGKLIIRANRLFSGVRPWASFYVTQQETAFLFIPDCYLECTSYFTAWNITLPVLLTSVWTDRPLVHSHTWDWQAKVRKNIFTYSINQLLYNQTYFRFILKVNMVYRYHRNKLIFSTEVTQPEVRLLTGNEII